MEKLNNLEGRDNKGRFQEGNKISIGNNGGRPTDYKEEYCQRIIDYFTVEPQQTVYKRTYYANGQLKSEDPVTLAEQLPTFQGFAHEIETTVKTMLEWAEKNSEFREAYARAKALQEKVWLINGMGGLYNSQFAQFFGKNCLGYKDKQEVDIGNKDGETFKIQDASLEDKMKVIEGLKEK